MVAEPDADRVPSDILAAALGLSPDAVEPVPVAGRVHLHWRVTCPDGAVRLIRVPRMSHLGLSPRANLTYAIEAFRRMAPSGSVPRLHRVLRVSTDLPWGAVVVDRIEGAPPALPGDLPAIARAVAAIHRLPVPDPAGRRPLVDPTDPVAYLLGVVREQLAAAAPALATRIRTLLDEEFETARRAADVLPDRPAATLTVSDCHPGNFRIVVGGEAVLLDVERPTYDSPTIDLAHASLPTSLTWDPAVTGTATRSDIVAFHRAWAAATPPALAARVRRDVLLYRRLIWLRTTTWACAWALRERVIDRLAAGLDDDPGDLPPLARRLARFIDPAMMEQARSGWTGADAFDPEELIP